MKAVSLALLPFALMLAACDAQAPAAPTPEASDAAQDEEALPADPGFEGATGCSFLGFRPDERH